MAECCPTDAEAGLSYIVYCLDCGNEQPPGALRCGNCAGSLSFHYERAFDVDPRFSDSMWRYWKYLPVTTPDQIVTLAEGGTPLLRSRAIGTPRLWFKDETRNPTGSHKDRALAVAVTHARAIKKPLSVVVSSGSTGISNAAMSARAGIRAVVVVAGDIPDERMYPAFALGATIVQVDSDVDSVIEGVGRLGASGEVYVSSTARSSNPYQAEGPKTIAYEMVEQLGEVPDWVVVPVGGGGTVAGIWRGFQELLRVGRVERTPHLLGVVAAGYDAIARAMAEQISDPSDVYPKSYVGPSTLLVKIAHVFPPDGVEAVEALRDSGGATIVVDETKALAAQARLGCEEGLYVEPSSAATLAGLERARESSLIDDDAMVVMILSGSGFRESFVSSPRRPLERMVVAIDDMPAVLGVIDGKVAH
jgi:threonine synthase